jgi:hypothetical protein
VKITLRPEFVVQRKSFTAAEEQATARILKEIKAAITSHLLRNMSGL